MNRPELNPSNRLSLMTKKIFSILSLLLTLFAFNGNAQERPVLSVYSLELGSSHIAETYLSPLKYSGWTAALNYERMQAMKFNPEKFVMRLRGRLSFENTYNPAGNASMAGINLDLGWAMMYRHNLEGGWTLAGGGYTSLSGGALYAARNSNNPVAGKAAWAIGPTVSAVWNGKIKKLPLCVRYIAEMPLTGVFFAPEYGELYYEIYLGNHKGLVHGAWPGNYFRLDNLLSVDLRFGATILRVGYHANISSAKANDIVTRRINHTAMVGVASEWVAIGGKNPKNLEKAKIISALY